MKTIIVLIFLVSLLAANEAHAAGTKYIDTCITERAGWAWCYTIDFLKNPLTFFKCRDLLEIGYKSQMCSFVVRLNLYEN